MVHVEGSAAVATYAKDDLLEKRIACAMRSQSNTTG